MPWRDQAQTQGCLSLRKMKCRRHQGQRTPLREEHVGWEHVGREHVGREQVGQEQVGQEHIGQEHVGRQVWFENGMPSWDVY